MHAPCVWRISRRSLERSACSRKWPETNETKKPHRMILMIWRAWKVLIVPLSAQLLNRYWRWRPWQTFAVLNRTLSLYGDFPGVGGRSVLDLPSLLASVKLSVTIHTELKNDKEISIKRLSNVPLLGIPETIELLARSLWYKVVPQLMLSSSSQFKDLHDRSGDS